MSVDYMLISTLSVLVEAREMLCVEADEALALWACNLKPYDLLSPLHLMCDLRSPNLSCIYNSDITSSPSGPFQTLIVSTSHNHKVFLEIQTRSCTL